MPVTFAYPQAFWLLPLVAAFLIVYLLAKRWRRATVTYAMIWQRLADQRTPRHWLKRLQRAATFTLSLAMLASAVLALAEPCWEQTDLPPAIDLVILLDNSPSMVRRTTQDQRALSLAKQRARDLLQTLRTGDRAWLLTMHRGRAALTGPFDTSSIAQADQALKSVQADFHPGTSADLVAALKALPSDQSNPAAALQTLMQGKQEQAPSFFDRLLEPRRSPPRTRQQRLVVITDVEASLRDLEWPEPWRQGVEVELMGTRGFDAAITDLQAMPGEVRVTWRGTKLEALWLDGSDASAQLRDQGEQEALIDLRFPPGREALRLRVSGEGDDPILENNELVLEGYATKPLGLSLAATAAEERDHVLMSGWLSLLTPNGANFQQSVVTRRQDSDVVFTLSADQLRLGEGPRALICFGTVPALDAAWLPADLPDDWNATSPQRVEHTFTSPLGSIPEISGSDANFRLQGTRFPATRTLVNTKGWTPLVASDDPFEAGLIATRKVGRVQVLFIGIARAYELAMRDPQGLPLMLRRWFERLALPPAESLQPLPLKRLGSTLEVALPEGALPNAELHRANASHLLSVGLSTPYLPGSPSRQWYVSPEGDRAAFDQTWYPGTYTFSLPQSGSNARPIRLAQHRVYWVTDPDEVPFGPIDAQPLDWQLEALPDATPLWPEDLPRWLLIAACALLMLEWLLYWLRVLD